MVYVWLFSHEAPLPSVDGTPRPTLSADAAEECHITSKKAPAPPADTPPPDSENVPTHPLRRMVPQDPEPQGHWHRQDQIPQDRLQSLQEPDQGTQLIELYLNHIHLSNSNKNHCSFFAFIPFDRCIVNSLNFSSSWHFGRSAGSFCTRHSMNSLAYGGMSIG